MTNNSINRIGRTSWKTAKLNAGRLADRLGRGIDAKIAPAVTALTVYGFKTTASCQGHLGRGEAAPWVDVAVTARPLGTARPEQAAFLARRKRNLSVQGRLL